MKNSGQKFADGEIFKNITASDFGNIIGETEEFVNCTFITCDFSDAGVDGKRFIDCRFENCNFSMTAVGGTLFSDVVFNGCKMLGVRFDHCNRTGLTVRFEECILDHATLHDVKIKNTYFYKTGLRECDLSEADLSGCVFIECDFGGALFDGTNLSGADMSTAFGFSIDPGKNMLRKAKFSAHSLAGLLDTYGIIIV